MCRALWWMSVCGFDRLKGQRVRGRRGRRKGEEFFLRLEARLTRQVVHKAIYGLWALS